MLEIKSKDSHTSYAHETPMTALWIELPDGSRLYFADYYHRDWDTDEETDEALRKVKSDIVAKLRQVQKMEI